VYQECLVILVLLEDKEIQVHQELMEKME